MALVAASAFAVALFAIALEFGHRTKVALVGAAVVVLVGALDVDTAIESVDWSTLGLLVGKQVGVFGFAYAAIRLRFADLPAHASWVHLYGVAILCGIGFTMSLFIGALAFPASPELGDETKIGVLMGSVLSAVLGYAVLRLARAPLERAPEPLKRDPPPYCQFRRNRRSK